MTPSKRRLIHGCTLEVHGDRGVVYVHGPQGITLLRICGLPTPIPDPNEQLDITHMFGANWCDSETKEEP